MRISPNDTRNYRQLVLENGLKILLIQDQDAQKASAALAVRVGHYDDPIHRQGLAHFLEHMLFLGTEKYPQVGEFQAFISRNGGTNNAWTGTEHTCFFFDIHAKAFEGGLDRFSQFFIAPTFNPEALDKERHAVQSEFEMKYKDESRRQYQVHKEVINPNHPFAKFSVGNLETLSDQEDSSIRDEVMDFYHQAYSADLMTVVIAAPHPLAHQEALAREYFSPIQNNHLADKKILEPLWREQDKQQFVHIEPEKKSRKLTLSFLFPAMDDSYRTKPLSYFAHLLGDESHGSLLQYLKKKRLITSLSAGGGISGNNFREFTISLALTKLGLTQIDPIIESVFYYIELLKQDGIAKWRFDEKAAVLESVFRFQERGRLIDLTSHLVMNLQLFDFDDVIYGDYMMTDYQESELRDLLPYLSVDNLRVTLVARKQNKNIPNNEFDFSQAFDKTAAWYDTPYRVAKFTPKQIQAWQAPKPIDELLLPRPNPYICTDFESKAKHAHSEPKLVQELDGFRLWHMQDNEFNVPKGMIFIAIDSPHAVATTENIVKTRLCVEMFLDALGEETYQAEIAGMSYDINVHQGGVTLKITGFSQKQDQLLDVILQKFSARSFSQERFDSIKNQLKRYWKNSEKDRPVTQLFGQMSAFLQPNHPSALTMHDALVKIESQDLATFVDEMLCELYVEMFVYGDKDEAEAVRLADSVKHALRVKNQRYEESLRPLVLLKDQKTLVYEYDCQQDDAAVIAYYQAKEVSEQSSAIYLLANHLMSAAFFHELRTKQQLGYMVGTSNMPLKRYAGLVLYVQSPNATSRQLVAAIDDFLNNFYLLLLELSESQWRYNKQGLLNKMTMPDNNLYARGQRFWTLIGTKDYSFTFRERVCQAIENLSREDMIRFVVQTLKPRTADRLLLHTPENQEQEEQSQTKPLSQEIGTAIQSIRQFQTQVAKFDKE